MSDAVICKACLRSDPNGICCPECRPLPEENVVCGWCGVGPRFNHIEVMGADFGSCPVRP